MTRFIDRTHAIKLRAALGRIRARLRESLESPTLVSAESFGNRSTVKRQILPASPTNLWALEIGGKLRRQLRFALKAADIIDLMQLEGRSRREVGLFRGISTKSLATIEALMRDARLKQLND